ncbi:M48 family metalloprotease [Bradyrhizobium sp. 200]|uniref:M48 family metalloprotease n=1 Tax=Bradyrhizobium sp. 200 TaxID=2782665 RepID=UPI001FFF615D|nr:M48 family metalloprotease [Bradyrhizobium sp. 200]UPJ53425.1 M48 family metalloprotease [Bradyrhizobium sp. 200]
MPSPKCIANVNSSPPPQNVWCGDDFCAKAQAGVDGHCQKNNYHPDDPWAIFDVVNNRWCSCCCSCYGIDTPLESRPGVFVKVQDIKTGDKILAAGPSLRWQRKTVSLAGGLHASQPFLQIFNVIYRYDKGIRGLQVTDDTLFLLKSGVLKTAVTLVPGDQLARADGGAAAVAGPVTKSFVKGVYSVETGPFDGKSLEGHLLNSFGVVTADYAVQRAYAGGSFRDAASIDPVALETHALQAGTEEYLERHVATKEFIEEVEAAGIRIDRSAFSPPKPIITVPENAKAFFHPDQAKDVRRNAPRLPSTNTFRITMTEKVISMAQPDADDVVMLIDWHNNSPNAYAWKQLRQKFVVITGGLLRIEPLTEAGIALVLSHAIAHHAGGECVGEADRDAIDRLRRLWPPSLFPQMCQRGVEEVTNLFKYIDPRDAEEDPDDRCGRPSLDCRHKVYLAEMGMQPLPECAGVPIYDKSKV